MVKTNLLCTAIACFLWMVIEMPSCAGQKAGGSPASPGKEAPGGTPPGVSPASRLKGKVKGSVLLTRDGLKKIGETAHDLKKDTLLLAGEITRKNMVQVRGPNVLPNGTVIPPMPFPTGVAPLGSLPPRSREMSIYMKDIAYNVKLLRNEMDALLIPQGKEAAISASWQQIRSAMAEIEDHYRQLAALTASPTFDTKKIGRQTVAIHDLAGHIDKLRKEIAGLLKGH